MYFKECINSHLGTLFLYRQCKTLKELLSNAPSPNKTDWVVHLELLFLFKENLLVGEATESYIFLTANYKRFFFPPTYKSSGFYNSLSSAKRKGLELA